MGKDACVSNTNGRETLKPTIFFGSQESPISAHEVFSEILHSPLKLCFDNGCTITLDIIMTVLD